MKGSQFILDFKNNKNFDYNFQLNCLNVEFRPYQIEGIKWIAFLIKYNMHGALCDDMGLVINIIYNIIFIIIIIGKNIINISCIIK